MARNALIITGIALFSLVLAACAADGASGSAGDPTRPPSSPQVDPVPSTSDAPVTGEVPQELLDRILADASDRSGVPVDRIGVTQAEAVEWSDGSLGCPEPGQMYTQAIEPGYHVLLDADGVELDYRATVRGNFRVCESDGPPFGG